MKTAENGVEHENQETVTQPSQNPDAQFPTEENNQQTKPTDENLQTLENPAQNNNDATSPPNGRIYYPTSSEEPYAYTPTYTPKETNMPITPIIPEN